MEALVLESQSFAMSFLPLSQLLSHMVTSCVIIYYYLFSISEHSIEIITFI